MHSKKYRQVRKLKLRSKSKSRRGRSLKGGAPQPYEYEGVSLVEGNDLIQLAVTRMDYETYTFNPVDKNFKNYCELAKYYCDKKSLACVRQIVTRPEDKVTTIFPSWVDLLGIALVLAKRFPITSANLQIATDQDIQMILMEAIKAIKKQTPLFQSSDSGCIISFTNPGGSFHDISGISEFNLDNILNHIKRMIFFCKYTMMPKSVLNLLTFNKIFNESDQCKQHVLDTKTFDENVAKSNFLLNKTQLYASANLKRAAQASSATPAPAPPSAAPAPPSADLESRVATLERDVAALKARQ